LSVTFFTELEVPWTWLPKDKLVGVIVTVWATAQGKLRGNEAGEYYCQAASDYRFQSVTSN